MPPFPLNCRLRYKRSLYHPYRLIAIGASGPVKRSISFKRERNGFAVGLLKLYRVGVGGYSMILYRVAGGLISLVQMMAGIRRRVRIRLQFL